MRKTKKTPLRRVPAFTSSIDAKVPAENIELTHYLGEKGRWIAYSKASDGRVFFGSGATEALARRAAGLRTFAYLERRASGQQIDLSPEEIEEARAEFLSELSNLANAVTYTNFSIPEPYSRDLILAEIEFIREIVKKTDDRRVVARWALPTLIFLSVGFANGIIGKLAEECLEILTKLLSL